MTIKRVRPMIMDKQPSRYTGIYDDWFFGDCGSEMTWKEFQKRSEEAKSPMVQDKPTEACQDELGIREKIALMIRQNTKPYESLRDGKTITPEEITEAILSLTVSSGGICPECKGEKTVPNYGWVNEPTRLEKVDITCPTCNGTGRTEGIIHTLLEWAKLGMQLSLR